MTEKEMPLAGQRALVTGASSGIGRAVALALAEAGADVVVNYRSRDVAAEQLSSIIRRGGRRAFAHRADVSREPEVQALFRRAVEELGGLEIVVSNAGVQRDAPIEEMSLEQWRNVIEVNLTGQFLCCREAARTFLRTVAAGEGQRGRGKIICISSVHDVIPWAGHANYAAAKGGVSMLMKTLAQELAPRGIRVNAISPGAIKTGINRSAWATPEAERELLRLIPYGRVGEPEDIGRAAVWLASDASDYVTGATLYVDGGMTLYPGFASGG